MAELPTKLQFTVVTLDRKVLEVEADEIMLPAFNGYIGVLPGHTPLLAVLRVGMAMYREGGRAHQFVIRSGFAEVLPDRVTAMVESATMPEEVDKATAEADRAAAERELAVMATHDEQYESTKSRFDEAAAKLQIVGRGE